MYIHRPLELTASSRVASLQRRIEEAASNSDFALAKSLKEERDRLLLSLTNRRNRIAQDKSLRDAQNQLVNEIEQDLRAAVSSRDFPSSKALKSRRDQLLQELNEWDRLSASFSSALQSQDFSQLQQLKHDKERIRVIWKERSVTLSKIREKNEQWDREDAARSIRFQNVLSNVESRLRQALRDEDFNKCEHLKGQRDLILSRQLKEDADLKQIRDEELKREEMLRQIEIRLELAKSELNLKECKVLKSQRDKIMSSIALARQRNEQKEIERYKLFESLDTLDKKIRDAASRRDFALCKKLKRARDDLFVRTSEENVFKSQDTKLQEKRRRRSSHSTLPPGINIEGSVDGIHFSLSLSLS